ncbi:MAG: DNA-processing protein DprA [Pelagimonas sp.]|nr:DNA-processing protein DprA [Pelagimonas sp.]
MRDDSYSSTHPPLPPTTEDDRVAWLRLLRSRRVGVATFYRLMGEHGSAQAALEALPEVARAAGVSKYSPCPLGVVINEMKAARLNGAHMVCRGEKTYPPELMNIADAPPVLWVKGHLPILSRGSVALVGARNASSLGIRMARTLGAGLGEAGMVVASGLARGIDTTAHISSLETGTVAVLAGGVDVMYPSENTRLAAEIIEKGGALISEQPMGMQPIARHFPMRNRIVSGLAKAVVVVEAAAKSGSLITARNALDQGREVMAVPGHPLDPRAGGCNILIRDGAHLVRTTEDILEALPPEEQPTAPEHPDMPEIPLARPEQRTLQQAAALHAQILDRLGPSPLAEDQLIRDLGGNASTVSPALTELELTGQVLRQPGGLLSLDPDQKRR